MPCGSTNTGRNMPKTPGSRAVADETALIGRSHFTGEPARTTAATRRHRIHDETLIPINPQAHTVQRIVGSTCTPALSTLTKVSGSEEPTKGCVNRSKVMDT